MKIALIEWDDSFSTSGWRDDDEIQDIDVAKCISIGIPKEETKHKITLLASRGNNQFSGTVTIPKGCIKRIRYLKVNYGESNE